MPAHSPQAVGPAEVVLVLLLAATGLALLARRLALPYPILLVLGGLALGLVPGLPRFELEPDLVFLLFLPPILFYAGWSTSLPDLRANLRPIALLAVGLVLATMVVVAAVLHLLVPELGWPVAFAFGAIVAPPDAVAATSIFQRLGAPRRIVTILEGESLLNDATALTAYAAALTAATTGEFSLGGAAAGFVAVAVGGTAMGLVAGVLVALVLERLDDRVFSVVISFLAPAVAFVAADALGVSGVLATVAAGIYVGRRSSRILSSQVRVAGVAAWEVLIFLITGSVFIIIGLELPTVLAGLRRDSADLLGLAAAVSLAAIIVRFAWVFPATYLPRWLSRSVRERDPAPPARHVVIVSWAGMRGVVSLAAALALPLTLADGSPFPGRQLLIFLTLAVILVTLVGQGLTLPLLLRRLGIAGAEEDGDEEAHARLGAAEAAVRRIGTLEREWPGHRELIDNLRAQYVHRARHLEASDEVAPDEAEQELVEHRIIRRAVIDAEREAVLRMRERGAVSDDVVRRIERDLDLEELRLEA